MLRGRLRPVSAIKTDDLLLSVVNQRLCLAIDDRAAEVDHNAFPVGTFRWKVVNMISPHWVFI